MTLIRLALCGLCLAAGLSRCAADERADRATDEARRPRQDQLLRQFDQLDVNSDGVLERAEAPRRVAERFDRIDLDGDGKLTRDEIAATGDRSGGRAPKRPGEVIAPAAVQERHKEVLRIGDPAPDFSLPDPEGAKETILSRLRADGPVVLVFGSYTCSPFRQRVQEMEQIFHTYSSRANFLFVYIREAHPDSVLYALRDGEELLEKIGQTSTLEERSERAEQCTGSLHLSFPVVVDRADNRVNEAYAAWPIRLAIVDTQGRVAYLSGPGPWGFKPAEVEDWLRRNLPPAPKPVPVEASR